MRTLAILFLSLLFTAVVSAISIEENFPKYFSECNSNDATKIDREAAGKLKRGEKFNGDQMSAYLNCMFKKFGIQDENGDYNQQTVTDLIKYIVSDQGNVDTIITNCGTRPEGSSAKAAALHLIVCSTKYDKLRFPSNY
ncbi:uncharacterized protein LOC114329540 isoform X3 [Diabrotica virgifera virgifera]|uniref:Uncharacterized protein n=1 Tax=Diabrotica virgifera virgifera TaxID=50390 RepID=A0ABM5JLM3_DIAVI|nr:uncharacterized protein LOC114329540 isoform X3 [Diabrotica virgifera virgifera]